MVGFILNSLEEEKRYNQKVMSTVGNTGGVPVQGGRPAEGGRAMLIIIRASGVRINLTGSLLSLQRGDDYKNHVKCVSEDQKYGGKGYEGKTHKGDVKQQAWLQVRPFSFIAQRSLTSSIFFGS